MKTKQFFAVSAFLAVGVAFAQANDIAKYDPRMALETAVVDTNGVKWIDGRYLPLEGKCYADTDEFYDRLPKNVTTNVNGGVRSMKHHSTGLQFRFRTDSKKLTFKWVPRNADLAMDHMPATGKSGIDVYRQEANGTWRYVKTGRITNPAGGSLTIPWKPGDACLVNLPLYNGIKSFTLGIGKNAKVEALGPRKSGIDKPVVFYGTSITHGGCASRPGLAFPSIVGRDLDVPIVNLGFSGSGKMEFEMSEHLAAIDASCYVLDCIWNMNVQMVKERFEPFIRNLRKRRPGVPIIMAERCDVYGDGRYEGFDIVLKGIYVKLKNEGWENLVYLPHDGMFAPDGEGTVDGCHPNDWGMMFMAKAYGAAVRQALGLVK